MLTFNLYISIVFALPLLDSQCLSLIVCVSEVTAMLLWVTKILITSYVAVGPAYKVVGDRKEVAANPF